MCKQSDEDEVTQFFAYGNDEPYLTVIEHPDGSVTKIAGDIPEDVVSHPSHYIDGRKYEPRLVIEDWDLDYYLGNALKYISRAGRKDPNKTIEDLKKAQKYLDFEIEKVMKTWEK